MSNIDWAGVMPAITTPFTETGDVDESFVERHVSWLLDHGCTGIIGLGSLGEGSTLTVPEKVRVLEASVRGCAGRAPVVAAIGSSRTAEAVDLAKKAAEAGCSGLMVLPPYLYSGAWHETRAHFSAIAEATSLSCMLYNNPIAYGTDLLPEHIRELADAHENVHAVKESSGDVRRVSAVRAVLGSRLALFAGLDDMIVEAVGVGARGWVAGLVNALPAESVAVFELARAGRMDEAFDIYSWFLPLLRLDTVPEFVQLIKLVQAEVGMGSERVRAPRQPLAGAYREEVLALVREHLARRPQLPDGPWMPARGAVA